MKKKRIYARRLLNHSDSFARCALILKKKGFSWLGCVYQKDRYFYTRLFSYEASIEFTPQISCTEHIFGDHMFVVTSLIALLLGQNWEIDYSQFIAHRFVFPRLTPTNCCSCRSSIIDSFCKLYSILYEFSRFAFLVLEHTMFS